MEIRCTVVLRWVGGVVPSRYCVLIGKVESVENLKWSRCDAASLTCEFSRLGYGRPMGYINQFNDANDKSPWQLHALTHSSG